MDITEKRTPNQQPLRGPVSPACGEVLFEQIFDVEKHKGDLRVPVNNLLS